MKRVVLISAVAALAVLVGTLTGCQALLDLLMTPTEPATAIEQVEGFLDAASADPQAPATLQAYFDPDAADYLNMYDSAYWELRFFNAIDGPYAIVGAAQGAEDAEFPGSVTVTGSVTNSINTDAGYAAVFVLTTDPDDLLADPLIRKITVTVNLTDEVIEKVIP
jgi:hypothetical protein